jgi:hypothetical protein
MTFDLSEEVKKRLDLATPAIVFFALPANQQIEVLPTLAKEQKYDTSQADLVTSNPLEVLIASYEACLNNLLIWLMVMLDDSEESDVENLINLVEALLSAAHKIYEDRFAEIGNVDSLEAPEWSELRRLSQILQQQLQIKLEISTTVINSFNAFWIHA